MRLCAFCAPETIAEEILSARPEVLGPVLAPLGRNAQQRDRAIEALRASSLIRRDPREKQLAVHRLVQAVLRETLSKEEQELWAQRVMRRSMQHFPGQNLAPDHTVNGC
jgi:hypothetical protein